MRSAEATLVGQRDVVDVADAQERTDISGSCGCAGQRVDEERKTASTTPVATRARRSGRRRPSGPPQAETSDLQPDLVAHEPRGVPGRHHDELGRAWSRLNVAQAHEVDLAIVVRDERQAPHRARSSGWPGPPAGARAIRSQYTATSRSPERIERAARPRARPAPSVAARPAISAGPCRRAAPFGRARPSGWPLASPIFTNISPAASNGFPSAADHRHAHTRPCHERTASLTSPPRPAPRPRRRGSPSRSARPRPISVSRTPESRGSTRARNAAAGQHGRPNEAAEPGARSTTSRLPSPLPSRILFLPLRRRLSEATNTKGAAGHGHLTSAPLPARRQRRGRLGCTHYATLRHRRRNLENQVEVQILQGQAVASLASGGECRLERHLGPGTDRSEGSRPRPSFRRPVAARSR